jgi:hypothetical protein
MLRKLASLHGRTQKFVSVFTGHACTYQNGRIKLLFVPDSNSKSSGNSDYIILHKYQSRMNNALPDGIFS